MQRSPEGWQRRWIGPALAGLLAFLTLGFVTHALMLGWAGLSGTIDPFDRFLSGAPGINIGFFSHMVFGAIITVLAPCN
ncbi:MAG: hypothetical protein AAGF74_04590 [Pseudomonadota bacterium]